MPRVTTVFTVERISPNRIKVFFNGMSARRTSSVALLLQMKLDGLTKGKRELAKCVLSRCTLGDGAGKAYWKSTTVFWRNISF